MAFPPSQKSRRQNSTPRPSAPGPKPRRPREPLQAPALFEYAVKSLAARMRTVRDLKRLLRNRAEEGEPGEAAVEAVLLRLKELNYLNDTRFAADFTRLRQENEKFGKRRVQQDLAQKGIHPELISTTLAAAYEDVDEVELARRYIARKRMKPPLAPDGKQDARLTARAINRLLRAGFSTTTIFKVLKNWGADDDSLAAIEAIDPNEIPDASPDEIPDEIRD